MQSPDKILPEVKNCSDDFGFTHPSITEKTIPITGVVGDQQSASIGQCCFDPGSLKSTYGTGAFVLLNTGSKKIYSSAKEALSDFQSGMALMSGGFGLCGIAENCIDALS